MVLVSCGPCASGCIRAAGPLAEPRRVLLTTMPTYDVEVDILHLQSATVLWRYALT